MRSKSCVLCGLLLVAACQSAGSTTEAAPVRTLAEPVEVQAVEFADAITIQEKTVDKTTLSILPTQPLAPVDERSSLRLTFDPLKLGPLVGGAGVPAMSDEEKRFRSRLQGLVDGLVVLTRESSALQAAVAEARRTNAVPQAIQDLRTRLEGTDAKWTVLLEAAQLCLVDEAIAAGLDVSKDAEGDWVQQRTDEFIRARSAALLPSGRMIDAEFFASIVKRQLDRLDEANRQAAAAVGKSTGATITVRAYLRQRAGPETSKALRVHVDNYDDLDRGLDVPKPAIGGFTAQEMAELRRRFQVTKDLASAIEGLRQDPERLWRQLRDDLETLGKQLKSIADAEFARLLTDLMDVVRGDEPLRVQVQQLIDLRARVDRVIAAVRSLRDAVRGEAPDVVALLQDLDGTLRGAWTELRSALAALHSLGELVTSDQLPSFVAKLEGEALTKGQAVLARLRTATVDGIRQASGIGAMVAALAPLRDLFALGRRVGDIPVPDSDAVLRHGVEAAPMATICLQMTPATAGDNLVVVVELIDKDGQKRVREHSQSLQVVRRGLRDSLDSHLLFVDRLHDSGVADQFVAAPSVSWTLHYRKLTSAEDAVNANDIAEFWNLIDPGIGLNVSALNFEDGDIEPGIGVHLTFFGDLLQVGYGRNLSVSDNEEFFFLGIGLIESLGVLGLADK
jgi:hypothetical protein